MADEDKTTIEAFHDVVNMSARELSDWLQTEESQQVGQKDDGDESIGHESGRRIVTILGKKRSEYTEGDIAHMRRVVSYVHRHTAQRPDGDIEHTRWRYSLMNWGNDPLK